ncbi:MAG: heme-dependent oxidative N-demethylase subunit alpha family protein [Verrucomicrobiota bacterium]
MDSSGPSTCLSDNAATPDWNRLFPDADYRLSMGLRPGDAERFWSDWDSSGSVHAQRQHWLSTSPEHYAACLDEGQEARTEALSWMRSISAAPEPDWVLMSAETQQEPRAVAGEVVFPSSWSLPDKIGLPMSAVHSPVPGLPEKIGPGIQSFLSRLNPEAAWERENWGFAADDELNHHPSRPRLRLTADARSETTWIRLEHQFLTRLPQTLCILFGIRVTCHRLDQIAALPGLRQRIHRALITMPEALARYKGLHECRHAILA